MDHYLGKEVVNNLLVLRFGNEMFGSIWHHRNIDSVQVRFILIKLQYLTNKSSDIDSRRERGRRPGKLFQQHRRDP